MGMLPSYIKLVGSMHTRYQFKGPVCSLGNQDIWASLNDLKNCLEAVGCTFHLPASVIRHSSRTFGMNDTLAETAKNFIHAATMFEAMGIEGYLDMDKFDSDKPAVLHDLNDPIDDDLKSRFGLVFDGGTIEHIFDVRQVLGNIVNMLGIGGCVVHQCSFAIDHGFYGFSPIVYYDFYGANGFGEFECYLLEVDFSDVTRTYANCHRCIKYEYGMSLEGVINTSKEILIFFVARKQAILPRLVVPTQGSYVRRGNVAEAPSNASQSAFDRLIPRWLQPFVRPVRPLLRMAYRKRKQAQSLHAANIKYI
jgi:hypothetical protein